MDKGEFRFVFFARDYEASTAFYRDGLQLPVIGGWDRSADDRGMLFQAASGIIEVIFAGEGEYVSPQGAWLYFEVDDVDQWFERAQSKGLTIRDEPADTSWGHRKFALIDPDGIIVSMFSPIR